MVLFSRKGLPVSDRTAGAGRWQRARIPALGQKVRFGLAPIVGVHERHGLHLILEKVPKAVDARWPGLQGRPKARLKADAVLHRLQQCRAALRQPRLRVSRAQVACEDVRRLAHAPKGGAKKTLHLPV